MGFSSPEALIGPSGARRRSALLRLSAFKLRLALDHFSMSALLETSLGDIVIDLLVDESPKACEK